MGCFPGQSKKFAAYLQKVPLDISTLALDAVIRTFFYIFGNICIPFPLLRPRDLENDNTLIPFFRPPGR
jgi:hypothetical protein